VGGSGYPEVGAGVDDEAGGGALEGLEDVSCQGGEGGGGEVFLAELDDIDAIGCPAGGLVDEGGLLLAVVAGK
jgi:hypothetical protein